MQYVAICVGTFIGVLIGHWLSWLISEKQNENKKQENVKSKKIPKMGKIVY